ncbi:PucR family transcriptional regulator [Paenibacillus sp. GCM10012307]
MMQLPLFRDAQVLAGMTGSDNEIFYVDSMEMPDLTGWLRPNELILTTGYSFRNEPHMLSRLLDEMHKVGGAAVGIKARRYLKEIPDEAILKSNEYGIPLFEIPPDVTYMDMTRVILDEILGRQAIILQEVQHANQQLTDLVLNRRTDELVVLVGQLLHCEAAILNAGGDIEACTTDFSWTDTVQKHVVRVGTRVFGYIAISRTLESIDTFGQLFLEHVVTVLAVEFTIRQSQRLRREQEQTDLLAEILLQPGKPEQEELVRYRAQRLDMIQGNFYYAASLELSEAVSSDENVNVLLKERLVKHINSSFRLKFSSMLSDGVLSVLCATETSARNQQRTDIESLLASIREIVAEEQTISFGIGRTYENLSEASTSLSEARKALIIGKGQRGNESWRKIFHIHDFIVEEMLLDLTGQPQLESLYKELIEPLKQYDREYSQHLLSTLNAYLRTGANTKLVAEQLFIHRNSVLYRLERIKEILQCDLNDAELRFRLTLAMRYGETIDIYKNMHL